MKREKDTKVNSKHTSNRRRTKRKGASVDGVMESGSTLQRSAVSKSNDPSWYAANPALMRDAASLPFGYPVGSSINWNSPQSNYTRVDKAMPGIFTMSLVTGPGATYDATGNDAVNIAARKIYSWVRHANSGSSNYDPVDLMQYMLAMDEAYMFYYNAVRAYGIMFSYNNQNRYFPKLAVEALGFNYEDLNANLAQFRYAINSFAVRLNSLAVPKGFPIYERHQWLYSNLYADGTSAKAQIYAFKPQGYRLYDPFNEGGGALLWYPIEDEWTVKDWIDTANGMVDRLLGNEDIGIMSGDILKAFKTSELIVLPVLNEVYTVIPVYDEEVLSQFQNATVFREIDEGSLDIYQNNEIGKGLLVFNPALKWNKSNSMISANRMLSLNKLTVTPEDVMVATRLMVIPEDPGSSTTTLIKHCGTEIATNAVLHNFIEHTDGRFQTLATTIQYERFIDVDAASSNGNELLYRFAATVWETAQLTKFKFHPPMWVTLNAATTDVQGCPLRQNGNSAMFWEVDNYTIIDDNILKQLHETAVLSEFRSLGIANW